MARSADRTEPGARLAGRVADRSPHGPHAPHLAEAAGDAAADEPRAGGLATFRSLRHRNYRLLWVGTLFSSAGLWLQQVTINHLAFQLSGSSFVVGLASGARSVPLLALGPVGGVLADRYDKKRLMLSTQAALAVATFAFALIVISGLVEVWHLFVFSLVSGVAWALTMPVRQSIVPTLVPREDVMNALALNAAGFNVTRILGPAVAGLMIASMGAGENFLLQAAAYAGVAFMVVQLAIPRGDGSARSAGSVMENLKQGARFVWTTGHLRTQMMLAFVPIVIAFPYIAILPQFNEVDLGGTPATFGLMMAAPGIGAVVATLVIASLQEFERKGLLLLGAIFVLGASLVLLGLAPHLWTALAALVLVGGAQMSYITTNQTVLQLSIPDEYRGRVMGIWMLNQGLLPLGSLFAGLLADLAGAPVALMAMGGLVAGLAVLCFLRVSSIRDLRLG